jgi:hypothetical protein
MSGSSLPLADDHNPFYCPEQDAEAFLKSLRHTGSVWEDEHELRDSFNSSLLQDSGEFLDDFSMSSDNYSTVAISPWNRDACFMYTPSPSVLPRGPKHERCPDIFSDLEGSTMHGLSDDYVNCDSFELSGKAEKFRYSYPELTYSPPNLALASMNLAEEDLVEKVVDLEGV